MKKVIAAHLFFLTLVACSGPARAILVNPGIPTRIPAATPIPSPFLPSQTPEIQTAVEWHGIPIMPGAIAGEGDEEGYVFTIQATSQQVQDYYQLELGKLGWQRSAQESGGSSMTLVFMDSAATMLTVSILSKGEEALVLLVK